MKAITLWQPWATWIAMGWKTIETRTHNRLASLVDQRIAIHAGKKLHIEAYDIAGPYIQDKRKPPDLHIDSYVPGVVVCTAMVAEARPLDAQDSAAALCDCSRDLYGLVLTDIQPLAPPPAAKGHQGIWEWTDPAATPPAPSNPKSQIPNPKFFAPIPQSPVRCRDCARLHHIRGDRAPNRQFWTADQTIADGCHGPVAPQTAHLATTGLAYPHYCTLFTPARESYA